jgi:hypothetical protein
MLRANEAELFWHPHLRVSAVILTASPLENASLTFAPTVWPDLRARRAAQDGEHLILGAGRNEHQLWLPEPPIEGSSLDDATPERADAVLRFRRHAAGRGARGDPTRNHSRRRVDLTLRALDGRLSGASYRAIAECLFGPARVAAEPWKSASVRDATIRLVRNGVALMQGGYRKFLRR